MSTEFTGERVIPGQVDINLWNEHVARYAFASRLSRNKRVLDAGCGTGYGSNELARYANFTCGIDLGVEAVRYGAETFHKPNLFWAQGSCTGLPFRDASFELPEGTTDVQITVLQSIPSTRLEVSLSPYVAPAPKPKKAERCRLGPWAWDEAAREGGYGLQRQQHRAVRK